MRNIYLILFVLIINILIMGCINSPNNPIKPSVAFDTNQKKKSGRIEFSEEIHNFGTLKEGEVVSYSFKFKNSGDASFRLTKVEPTCGCLSVKYDNLEVLGQETSTIEVIFHSDGEWGNQIKTVEIETSLGEKKSLTVGAFVENKNFNIDLNSSK